MRKTNHPRIPHREWETHKETIRKMYLSEDKNLMGEGGVIDLMKRKGFSASKPQYESQFMRWGFKKKLTREAWHTLGRIIRDRDNNGLISYVYVNGMNLSNEKVKKETARYRVCDANGECCLKEELPNGIEVRSDQRADQEEAEETILSLEAQDTRLDNSRTISLLSKPRTPDESWDHVWGSNYFGINSPTDVYNRMLTDLPSPNFPREISPNFSCLEMLPWTASAHHSPSISFPYTKESPDRSSIPRSTISLFTDLNIPLFREFRALFRNNQSKILDSINKTKYLLPREPGQELQRDSVDKVILKQILYLLMNNFAGSDYAVFDTIFEQVRQFPVAHMEDMLKALPPPFAASLQESILTIAIKSNIPVLVSVLLRRGLEINKVVCRFHGRQYTPLGLACKFRGLEIVKILLLAGADPHRTTYQDSHLTLMRILDLEYSHHEQGVHPPIVSDILRCILDAHAGVTWRVLASSRFWKSEAIIDVFIRYNKLPIGFPNDHEFDILSFDRVLELGEGEKATAVFRSASQGLALDEDMRHSKKYFMGFLEMASYQGNLSLVDYFLEFGLTPSLECLCQAIQGNHLVLVKRYIQLGVRIHEESYSMIGRQNLLRVFAPTMDSCLSGGYSFDHFPITPFADAILHARQEIISCFQNCNLLPAAATGGILYPAILAAVAVGNMHMTRELLAMDNQESLRTSSVAKLLVAAATFGGNDENVELLMMAGVRPNDISVAAAILTRNARLVELFLNSSISMQGKSALAYLAVRWGDPDVLRLLIDAGVSVNEDADLHVPQPLSFNANPTLPLVEAILRGNQEILHLLLQNGADVNCPSRLYNDSPLARAVECGHETLIQTLLDHGADPNDPYALQTAAKKSYNLARIILDSFCQRYPKGSKSFAIPALREAIEEKDETLISMLANYADINTVISVPSSYLYAGFELSLLGEGIATGSVMIVQTLLSFGGKPDSTVGYSWPAPQPTFGYGFTELEGTPRFSCKGRLNAVLTAISIGHLGIVKLLHSAKANLNFSATLRITHTALQLAVELGHVEIVKFLLEQRVDVNASPCMWGGGTALQYAAKTGSVRIAEMLIEHGADVDAPGSKYQGRTAFEFAAEHGRIDMLLWLFHQGANIGLDGGAQIRRAQELAEENGQIAARDLVEQLGAAAQCRAAPAFEDHFFQRPMTDTSTYEGLLGTG